MMNLDEEAKKVNWNNGSEIIDFYESHKLYFYNTDHITDKETLYTILKIKYHYANSLFIKTYFDKVFPAIDKARELLDKFPKESKKYDDLSQSFLFLEARTLNNKKEYRKAQNILEKLLKIEPDNQSYRDWYLNNKLGLYDNYFNVFLSIAVIMILLDLAFSFSIDFGLIGIGLVAIVYFVHKGLQRRIKSKLSP
ncbi:hypothetical protein [Rhodohalobacter sp. 8-1]|uniref:hypothetical protein n=1 Tax=Rhodohalobacter sp. 8-1 TaxID=3131972 RepID=UPI0030EE387B